MPKKLVHPITEDQAKRQARYRRLREGGRITPAKTETEQLVDSIVKKMVEDIRQQRAGTRGRWF